MRRRESSREKQDGMGGVERQRPREARASFLLLPASCPKSSIVNFAARSKERPKTSTVGTMQRFKEMKELHDASSHDDRKKREQQRQEREMTKIADTRKQQQLQQNKQEEDSENAPVSSPAKATVAPLAVHEQRKILKFGFSSESSRISKVQQ
ncbi:unnamed protein product [Eruca vesicaria subsp. sativa]|uniref:Uncharacterized protein n=1 Tax=Eruca vesicaria subsp. sativa TaxID=29727 RepID=A0ABC8K6S7_ERUVS|nr:unnamed protein product [Eruca vesicaria subsp. sativa]